MFALAASNLLTQPRSIARRGTRLFPFPPSPFFFFFFRVVPDRYPDDPGRVAARVRLREVLASGKGVQGARVFPHELVEKLMKDAEREMLLEASCF